MMTMPARELLASKECSATCLLAWAPHGAACGCRCGGRYHGKLADTPMDDAARDLCDDWFAEPGRSGLVEVEVLPRAYHSDALVRTPGYVVCLAACGNFFFRDREPALVFGRAGRMSPDVSSYGVRRCVRQDRYVEGRAGDVVTLLVARTSYETTRGKTDRADLQRWLEGVVPDSSYWHLPRCSSHRSGATRCTCLPRVAETR